MMSFSTYKSIFLSLIIALSFSVLTRASEKPIYEKMASKVYLQTYNSGARNFELLPRSKPNYIRIKNLLSELVSKYGDYRKFNKFNLDSIVLYVFEMEDGAQKPNIGVTDFGRNHTFIIVKMSKKELENLSDEALQFILAHEIGHGLKNIEKRYYVLNEKMEYRIPRFTSEEVFKIEDQFLYNLIHFVGINTASEKVSPFIYDGILSKLMLKSLKLIPELLTDKNDIVNKIDHGNSWKVLSEISKAHNAFINDFIFTQKDEANLDYVHSFLKTYEKQIPKFSQMTLSHFFEKSDTNEGAIEVLKKLLFVDQQISEIGIEKFEKKHVLNVLVSASEIYQKRYNQRKSEFQEILPRIRYYSEESIADEMAYKTMLSLGVKPKHYMSDFLKFNGLSNYQIKMCIEDYIDKKIEPPMGNLIETHPPGCWRMFSLQRLFEYQAGN